MDRTELIQYKNKCFKSKLSVSNNFWLTFDFLNLNHNHNSIIKNAWYRFNSCNERISDMNLKLNIAHSNMNNLNRIFIHGAKLSLKNFNFSCKPCNESLCNACFFSTQKIFQISIIKSRSQLLLIVIVNQRTVYI